MIRLTLRAAFVTGAAALVLFWWRGSLPETDPVGRYLMGLHLTATIFFAVIAADCAGEILRQAWLWLKFKRRVAALSKPKTSDDLLHNYGQIRSGFARKEGL